MVREKYHQAPPSLALLPQPISTLPQCTSCLRTTPAGSPGPCASLETLRIADRTMALALLFDLETAGVIYPQDSHTAGFVVPVKDSGRGERR